MIPLFVGIVAILLSLDIYIHRKPEVISLKSASLWSIFYIVSALAFAGVLYANKGADAATLFLTGYALEKMLAVDNLVVFVAIFAYWRIDDKYQHRVLHLGILGAILFRLLFVAVGATSLAMIGPKVDLIFAAIIIYTAILMIKRDDDKEPEYFNAWYIRPFKKRIDLDSKTNNFFVKSSGRLHVTRLFLALITIEVADIMFSFDSVPAVIAVTKDPFLIYGAMIFAILGLRSLYFVLSALLRYLVYLEVAVICVLFLIAGKLLAGALLQYHLPPSISLLITLGILIIGIIASLASPQVKKQEE